MDFLWTAQVVLYTGYHNATRCFEETLDRGKAQAWNSPGVSFQLVTNSYLKQVAGACPGSKYTEHGCRAKSQGIFMHPLHMHVLCGLQ